MSTPMGAPIATVGRSDRLQVLAPGVASRLA